MSIDHFRSGFLFVLVVALLVVGVLEASLTIAAIAALLLFCSLGLAVLPQRAAGYMLGGFALAAAGSLGAYLAQRVGLDDPLWWMLSALVMMGAAAFWLALRWSAQTPVRYAEVVHLNTIFGRQQLRGPTRFRYPPFWFGKVMARIPLTPQKISLCVHEITTSATALLRETGGVLGKSSVGTRPDKLHSVELSIGFVIDDPNWFLLYRVPYFDRYAADVGSQQRRGQSPREQTTFWAGLAERWITEETPEHFRMLIHQRGWTSYYVDQERNAVARELHEALRAEAAKYGIVVQNVALIDVHVDAPVALRDARNMALRARGRAEEVELMGDVLLELQEAFLRRFQRSLRNAGLNAADINEIVRTQARELGWHLRQHGHLDYFLDEYVQQRPRSAGGPLISRA
jgi:hypothetical protein